MKKRRNKALVASRGSVRTAHQMDGVQELQLLVKAEEVFTKAIAAAFPELPEGDMLLDESAHESLGIWFYGDPSNFPETSAAKVLPLRLQERTEQAVNSGLRACVELYESRAGKAPPDMPPGVAYKLLWSAEQLIACLHPDAQANY